MSSHPLSLQFAPGEEPDGFGQGHFAIALDRRVSTEDFGQTCMVIIAANDLLGHLASLFSGHGNGSIRFEPLEATRMSVWLERKGGVLRISDDAGLIGEIDGETFIEAALRETEALAALCVSDPDNGALDDVRSARARIEREFPRIREWLRSPR
jgi:hypothetical protein